MGSALKNYIIEPSGDDLETSRKLEKALAEGDKSTLAEIVSSPNIREAMLAVFSTLAEGSKVTIAPSEATFTSQEAASFLNVSRPYLNKLLDANIIPSYKDGTHRRVYLKDLISYKMKRENGHKALDELSNESQKLNLGW